MHGAVEEAGQRGKGPRNYARSDARVFEDVGEALTHEDAIDASDITIAVVQGEAMLEGTVPTARMKALAEDLVAKVAGVRAVTSRLRTKMSSRGAKPRELSGPHSSFRDLPSAISAARVPSTVPRPPRARPSRRARGARNAGETRSR